MSSLIRFHYGPFAGLDGVFDDAFNRPDSFRPRLDLHESNDSNTITAIFELPGLTSDDVSIDLHHNRLTVSGESTRSNAREEDGYTVRERHYGKFFRTLHLPFGTKPDDLNAKMENGLLTVTFPRETSKQSQRIAIQ